MEQDKTGSFQPVACITSSNYTSGMTVEIDANYNTRLYIIVLINQSLCNNDIDLADDYTRVYVTISTVCTNELATFLNVGYSGDFFEVRYLSVTWSPASDMTYSVTVDYDAYY